MLQPVPNFGVSVPLLSVAVVVGSDALQKTRREEIAHAELSGPRAILRGKGPFLVAAFAAPGRTARVVDADDHASRDAGGPNVFEGLAHSFARPDAILARLGFETQMRPQQEPASPPTEGSYLICS